MCGPNQPAVGADGSLNQCQRLFGFTSFALYQLEPENQLPLIALLHLNRD